MDNLEIKYIDEPEIYLLTDEPVNCYQNKNIHNINNQSNLNITYKLCNFCNIVKPIIEFAKNGNKHRGDCKSCYNYKYR